MKQAVTRRSLRDGLAEHGRRFLCLFVALLVVAGMVQPVFTAQADTTSDISAYTYPDIPLVAYGLPASVVQVICDNSMMEDGKSPCADGRTAQNLTLADVQKMKTFSVATRTVATQSDSDSSLEPIKSTPNDAVATWVAGVVDNAARVWSANAGDPSNVVTADEGIENTDVVLRDDLWADTSIPKKILTDGVPKYNDGSGADNSWHDPTPVFNVLMAVASSATNAAVIDLTGLLSKVTVSAETYPGIRLKLLALLQAVNMPTVTTLKLGYNNLGGDLNICDTASRDACTDAGEYWFRTMLGSSTLEALYMDSNNLHSLDSNLLSTLSSSVSHLYLYGNDLNTLSWNNGGFSHRFSRTRVPCWIFSGI